MKISQMVKREDFYSILEDTVNEYYPGGLFSCRNNGGERYFSLAHLNAIICKGITDKAKAFISDEFRYSSLMKNMLSSMYTRSAFACPSILSSRRLFWLNAPEERRHILIFPSNRKIRFMNFNSMQIHVHMKTGFDNEMMKRETAFRMEHSHLPFILPVSAVTERSYSESIMEGNSAARCKSNKIMKDASVLALRHINALRDASDIYSREASEYAVTLSDNICRRLIDSKYDKLKELCRYAAQNVEKETVRTAISHGDLQMGNIWIRNGSIIIMDWESVKRRIDYYDEAVLLSGIRNTYDYAASLTDIMRIVYNNHNSLNSRNIVRIFLLEDINWMIDEQTAMNGKYESYGITALCKDNMMNKIRPTL